MAPHPIDLLSEHLETCSVCSSPPAPCPELRRLLETILDRYPKLQDVIARTIGLCFMRKFAAGLTETERAQLDELDGRIRRELEEEGQPS